MGPPRGHAEELRTVCALCDAALPGLGRHAGRLQPLDQRQPRRILGNNVEAVRRAFTDTGRAVPDEYRYRTVGAQDVEPAGEG